MIPLLFDAFFVAMAVTIDAAALDADAFHGRARSNLAAVRADRLDEPAPASEARECSIGEGVDDRVGDAENTFAPGASCRESRGRRRFGEAPARPSARPASARYAPVCRAVRA